MLADRIAKTDHARDRGHGLRAGARAGVGQRNARRCRSWPSRRTAAPCRSTIAPDISRAISAVLDVEDPISSAYSAWRFQLARHRSAADQAPRITSGSWVTRRKWRRAAPVDGRKRFKGPIKSVDANAVELTCGRGGCAHSLRRHPQSETGADRRADRASSGI